MKRLVVSLLITVPLWAADFQTGQAARAVIGQDSFSAREATITPTVLTLSAGHLYVGDASHRLLTYDLNQIPGAKLDLTLPSASRCPLCGFSPVASVAQSVLPGVASVASFGKTVAIADTAAHRVLIWRDTSSPRAVRGPDLILGRSGSDLWPVSGATIVEPISVAFDGKRLFVGDGALHRVLIWNSLPSSESQAADTVLGQPNMNSMNTADIPSSDSVTRPVALASDGTNLYVADSVDHRILIFTAADMPMPRNAILNSASMTSGSLAPGALVTIAGRGFSDTTESVPDGTDESLPNRLAGVEVFIDGTGLPLLSASPTEIRAQLPYDLDNASSASLYVRTEHSDGTVTVTNAIPLTLLPAAPGLFAFAGQEPRIGMVLHVDAASGQANAPVTSESPAKPGEVLVLWAAGLGAVDSVDKDSDAVAGVPYKGPDAPVSSPVTAFADDQTVQVISATLPHGAIGIYEVRIQLPLDLPGTPSSSLTISQDGHMSNSVAIPIENSQR